MHKTFAPVALVAATVLIATAFTAGCDEKKPEMKPAVETAKAPAAESAAATAGAPAVLASGTLTLPEGSTATGKMVFVSLRGAGGGPPIAAVRLPAGPFPMKFELTEANVVAMGGQKRPVPEEFNLKATLDVDGNPMAKSPEDMVIEQKTKKGSTGLSLTLAKAGG